MSLDVTRVRVPLRRPFATAAGPWTAREAWIVVQRDGPTRCGLGESSIEDGALDAALDAARLDLAGVPAAIAEPAVALADPRDGPEGPAATLAGPGHKPVATIGVNATLGAVATDDLIEAAVEAVGAGFRTLKVKATPGEPTLELAARLGSLRRAVGSAIALRLDANGTWDFDGARARLRALEPVGLAYVEQPLAPGDLAGAAALRAAAATPIAADEAVASAAAARAVLDAGAADVLVVKPSRVGGPTAAAWIAMAAAARGVPVVLSSMFETGVGLAAALAAAARLPDVDGWPAADRDHGLATADLLEDDLLEAPLVVERGRMRAPGGPGTGALGIRLDAVALERYRVAER